ncbi:unnamed protein product [Meloidogyne enterolobii]|uniref:Uncharacterized protein n=1 Tax=Meloidogyne enterolobii TaxID=390850 RepID=A0ACB0XT94_MELEN
MNDFYDDGLVIYFLFVVLSLVEVLSNPLYLLQLSSNKNLPFGVLPPFLYVVFVLFSDHVP